MFQCGYNESCDYRDDTNNADDLTCNGCIYLRLLDKKTGRATITCTRGSVPNNALQKYLMQIEYATRHTKNALAVLDKFIDGHICVDEDMRIIISALKYASEHVIAWSVPNES